MEVWHLGPFAGKPRFDEEEEDNDDNDDDHDDNDEDEFSCICGRTWRTCDYFCWGSDMEDGVWMTDWDAKLADAVAAAREAAGRPVARAVLAALRSGEDFRNFDVSEAAMARLLDLAILTGDAELAQRCAQRCTRRPLRRWCSQDFFVSSRIEGPISASAPGVMAAAILSGVALQGLSITYDDSFGDYLSIPLREAIALCGDLQLWQRLSSLLPEGQRPWIPKDPHSGVLFYIESDGKLVLCLDRLRTASLANMALSEFVFGFLFTAQCHACGAFVGTPPSVPPRLLDRAIYFGQSACAELLASCGAASTAWTRAACLPDKYCDECGEVAVHSFIQKVPLGDRRAAAGAALRAALTRAQQLAAPMGLGIYQVLLAWGCGKKVPKALVNIVLSFAAERPQIACVLEGHEEELLQAAAPIQEQEHQQPTETAQAPETLTVVPEQEHPSEAAEATEAPEAPEAPDAEMKDEEAVATETDDLLRAVRNSRVERSPLSTDGVICFRLTRKANAPHVNELLFDANGLLAELHRRVLDAGCEVAPEWSPVKALFVPLTKNQLDELTGCFTCIG